MKKTIESICDIVNLLFRPRCLAEKGAQETIDIELKKHGLNREDEREAFCKTQLIFVYKVRNSYAKASALVLIFSLLSWLSSTALTHFFGTPSDAITTFFQLLSAAILLIATLGLLGWEIQTINGFMPHERANKFLYRSMYCIGTYILMLSLLWK